MYYQSVTKKQSCYATIRAFPTLSEQQKMASSSDEIPLPDSDLPPQASTSNSTPTGSSVRQWEETGYELNVKNPP
jgi:hypothetical protein